MSYSCRNAANWGYSKSAPTYQLLKAQKCANHDEYWYHLKHFILASANSYYNFHILFIDYVLYFPLRTSTLHFPCFSFFFIDRTLNQVLSIRAIHPCFVKGRSSVSQAYKLQQLKMKSNTPRGIQYNIGFQISYSSYSFAVFFDTQ